MSAFIQFQYDYPIVSSDFSRRLSIDQLTEEAEADLANNNDPNNNASSGNDGQDQGNNYHQDQHEVHEQQQQQQQILMATATDDGPSQNQNSAFEFDFDEPETETNNSRLSFDVDDDDVDPFQAALDRDVQLILKLMPDKAQDEVRYMLESHQENPSRVQVRRNYFLSILLRLVTWHSRSVRIYKISFSRVFLCRNMR